MRIAADGDPDPLRVILPAMLEGEGQGVVLDAESLRGVLRKLGCEVTLFWVPNPEKKASQDAKWVLDRGQLRIYFRWSAHSAPTTTCTRPSAGTRCGH